MGTAGPATGYRRPLGYVVEIIEPETTDEIYQIVCVVVDYTAAFLRKITIEIRPDYDALLERRLFVNVAGLRGRVAPHPLCLCRLVCRTSSTTGCRPHRRLSQAVIAKERKGETHTLTSQ